VSLYVTLRVNDDPVGRMQVTRRSPERPGHDDVCRYDWLLITTDGLMLANDTTEPVEHRYGDGAWTLVVRVLDAAGYRDREGMTP
jgi:hypothetical protein